MKDPIQQKLTKEMFKKVLRLVVPYLKKCKGFDRRVTNKDCRYYYLQRQKKIRLSSIQFRKIVQHIRNNGLIHLLIATGQGYWVAASREEAMMHIKSMKKRGYTMINTANKEYGQLIKDWDRLPEKTPQPKVKKQQPKKKATAKRKPAKNKKTTKWSFPNKNRSKK